MKKNITICCDAMDTARVDKQVWEEGEGYGEDANDYTVMLLEKSRSTISFCPWCGKELPFPHEEAE